ncbi:MAG: hypothetical protein COA94_06080 [Rickettsiales bacterium]|nr:MAG: hypothetical protein COA94_06080 [Rickettsiales bacterium]
MWLRVNNLYTTIAKAEVQEIQWLWNFLSYEDSARERAMGVGTVRLLSKRHRRFPTGLVPLVEKHAKAAGFDVKRIDTRQRPHPRNWDEHLADAELGWLKTRLLDGRPYQFDAIVAAIKSGRGIIRAPTGCHARGQKILMYDGSPRAVEDVRPGEYLMGPDGEPRRVAHLCRGRQKMVRVVPKKGDPWVVNLDHVLTLVRTNDDTSLAGKLVDVRVRDWLDWSRTKKHVHKLVRCAGLPRKSSVPGVFTEDLNQFGFTVEHLPEDDYFGFTLDGDGRYLLDDFTITHNSGKGEMVVGICKAIPCKWLFLVHRSHLAEDIQQRWEARGDGSGHTWLGRGNWELGDRVSFCTFQTLYRALSNPECRNALQHVQGVVIDETHVLPAGSFMEVSEAMPNAYYRIGLSGTPLDRGDGKSLMAVAQTGSVVYNVTPRSLMDAGFVARATVRVTEVKQKKGLASRTWVAVRKAYIAESAVRNAAVLRDVLACQKPAMVFVDLLSHGRILRDAIEQAGLTVEFAWGAASKANRAELVQRVRDGDLDVLVANGVFREGVDIPSLASVVYACGGKSTIQVIQGAGRGSRVTANKTEFTIYDYLDRGHRWLEGHSDARVRIYTRYGYSVLSST